MRSHVAHIDPVELFAGVYRKTLISGERIMICQIVFAPGGLVPTHQHPHEQAGYVLEGKLRLTIAGEELLLEAGESYVIPSATPHAASADIPTTVLDIFSPPRDEYK